MEVFLIIVKIKAIVKVLRLRCCSSPRSTSGNFLSKFMRKLWKKLEKVNHITALNTVISPNFLVWKFEKTHSFPKYSGILRSVALREKLPYSDIFWSVFFRIQSEYGELRSFFPYSGKYGPENLRIRTLFTHSSLCSFRNYEKTILSPLFY